MTSEQPTELELVLQETDENPYVAAVLGEHRMARSSAFLDEWRASEATDGASLRTYTLRASGHIAGLYELMGRIHSATIRMDAQVKDETATKYDAQRREPTTTGRPKPEADCKAATAIQLSEKLRTSADLDAAKTRVERRIRAIDRMAKSAEAVLRSLGDEIRAGMA